MSSRIRKGLVAVGAAWAAVAGLPGTALADSAVPFWQSRGEPVKGTTASTDAPPLKAGTSYKDTIKVGETKYYGVDVDGKSSAYLSAFALPRPADKVAFNDGLKLVLESTDGTQCDSQEATFRTDGAARPVGNYVRRTIEPDGDCQEAGHYTFSVTRSSAGTSDPGAWPVEIRYMSEPGLKTGASPGPAMSPSSASPTPVTGTARQTKGGTRFDDAPALGTGIWKDKVLPGGTRLYRVPVDWGQQAYFTSDFANAKAKQSGGFQGDGVRVDVYNPARGYLESDTASYSGEPASVQYGPVSVAYANRYESYGDTDGFRFAGWYYYAVSVHPDVAKFIDGAVPVILRVDVKGAVKGVPSYDGDAAKAGFGITDDGRKAAEEGVTPDGSDSALRIVAFGALGTGTVLVLSLAVWVTAARRRPRPAGAVPLQPAAGPQQYGPPPT